MTKKLFIIVICMLATLLQIGCKSRSTLFADRIETIEINPTTVEPTVEIADSSPLEQDKLIVSGDEAQIYQCENGNQVTTNHYSLSDDSFQFVRIIDPDGKEHFLPHVYSGSGAKYTDNYRVVWWTKGNLGHVSTRQENGDWQITHRECELTEAASVDSQDLTMPEKDVLTLSGGETQTYQCENGDQVTANYYSLFDSRIHFVRIIDPSGKKHLLPHVYSGSGAKFTDNFRVVWWTKGNSGHVSTRQENGDWQITHRECELIED